MDTSFQRSVNYSDEWYTPPEIIEALGEFDLDPCAAPPDLRIFNTARESFSIEDNGLEKEWFGRVWMNPPYSRSLVVPFARKFVEHGNGIMLTFNRLDNKLFQDVVLPGCDAIMFLKGRLRFFRPDGTRGDSAGCGSVLVAAGEDNARALRYCGIEGFVVSLK